MRGESVRTFTGSAISSQVESGGAEAHVGSPCVPTLVLTYSALHHTFIDVLRKETDENTEKNTANTKK